MIFLGCKAGDSQKHERVRFEAESSAALFSTEPSRRDSFDVYSIANYDRAHHAIGEVLDGAGRVSRYRCDALAGSGYPPDYEVRPLQAWE